MQQLPDADFDELQLAIWRSQRYYKLVVCSKCSNLCVPFGRGGMTGLFRRGKKFTCKQCSKNKDVRLYGTKDVIRHTRQGTECELVCLECSPSQARHLKMDSYACTLCEKHLSVNAFSVTMQKCKDLKQWRCESCRRPTCTSCGAREPTPLNRLVVPSAHVCMICKYPPCAGGCGTERPGHANRYNFQSLPIWRCAACKTKVPPTCTQCISP
jgi:hypothetical protein